MPRLTIVTLACALLVSVGCGTKSAKNDNPAPRSASGQPPADATPVKVLPKPDNGAPLAVEFLDWVGDLPHRGVELQVYNHAEVTIVGMTFVLRYYDDSGKLLLIKEGTSLENDNDFGTVVGDAFHCEPARNLKVRLDSKILAVPEAATRAEVLVSKVYQADPESGLIVGLWTQDNFTEWPGDPTPTPGIEEPSML